MTELLAEFLGGFFLALANLAAINDAVALEKFIMRNLRVSKARVTMEEKRVAL